ncbi:hypothetical protein [Demequina sp. NBRC 110056]|uniref:hypothetical protein n=1 Tax=Demequina sp. NBRC 110056 TaxID=1570345 RepID=UPI00117F4319|nr:hypothetical protein [Demequina sp. NBRC 110056]
MSDPRAAARPNPNGAVDRRRVLKGAVWTAPAVVVASALPAAASSVTAPVVTVAGNGSANSNPEYAFVSATADFSTVSATGSYLDTGFTVTLTSPRANATLQTYEYDSRYFSVSPAQLPGNQTPSVIFTYVGPRLTAPSAAQFTFSAGWNQGVPQSPVSDRVIVATLVGQTGAGRLEVSTNIPVPKSS